MKIWPSRFINFLANWFLGQGDRGRRRGAKPARRRLRWDRLEGRDVLSVIAGWPGAATRLHHPIEVRSSAHAAPPSDDRMEAASMVAIKAAKKKASFSVAELKKILPGKWRVQYDASSLFGPGARGAQEITFTGPKGSPTFVSTTGVVVQGFFAPAYYQFTSYGTYQFLSNKLVRLTITGGSPTEYLNRGIIVPGGQFFPIEFQGKNQFTAQGQVYNRIPLDSTLFNS